ncbi:MAG: hypothetical protein AABW56_05205 [Nanoarchaeota archaeon]
MKLNKECEICHMGVTSDANSENYCKLCGMLIEENQIIKKIKGSINYFCCKLCMKKYFAFKFNKYEG